MRFFITSLLVLFILKASSAKSKEDWKTRAIYQLLTDRFASSKGASPRCSDIHSYCGGDFKGITQHLDYIQGLGFDAIWISPVIENYEGGYHGYDAIDLYQINSKFGGDADLRELIKECHKRDIWVMVDVVANHMGNLDENFTPNKPFDKAEHYHPYCLISNQDFETHNLENIRRCRLAGLSDLNQEHPFVRSELIKWIKWLISEYQFDGIRIDTVPQVHWDFWNEFTKAAGVYSFGEVFDGDKNFLAKFSGCMDAVLNYPLFYLLRDVFLRGQSMYSLKDHYDQWISAIGETKIAYLGNFNDNHDNIRFMNSDVRDHDPYYQGGQKEQTFLPSNVDKKKSLKSIVTFVLTSVGVPIIYYGTEQEFGGGIDPLNREVLWGNLDTKHEMYQFIAKVNAARKYWKMGTQPQVERWRDDDVYAYTRGKVLVAFSNKQDRQIYREVTYHPYTDGQILCNVLADGDCIKVQGGKFQLYLNYGEVKIFTPATSQL